MLGQLSYRGQPLPCGPLAPIDARAEFPQHSVGSHASRRDPGGPRDARRGNADGPPRVRPAVPPDWDGDGCADYLNDDLAMMVTALREARKATGHKG